MGRGAGVLFAAFDHAARGVSEEAAEFMGEPRDEFVLLVQGQARDSHGLLRKELSHKKAQETQMVYLVAAAQEDDLAKVRAEKPELWRQVRRYNKPVQLALAAADKVVRFANDPATAAVISLAPCQPGSADLYSWGHVVTSGMASGTLGNLRMNPTQTLHAVDNLAMSAFAIAHRNQAYCLGLGGAAGQAWCGIEAVLERLDSGLEEEALLMAGDQDAAEDGSQGLGVALLFSTRAQPFQPSSRIVRLVSISRRPAIDDVVPHAANGLAALLSAITEHRNGVMSYVAPGAHTDGFSTVIVTLEIS